MNVKTSVFDICVEAIIYLLLHNLHDCTFNHHVLPDINFNGSCLINNNISISKKVINLVISYILNPWLKDLNTDFY